MVSGWLLFKVGEIESRMLDTKDGITKPYSIQGSLTKVT